MAKEKVSMPARIRQLPAAQTSAIEKELSDCLNDFCPARRSQKHHFEPRKVEPDIFRCVYCGLWLIPEDYPCELPGLHPGKMIYSPPNLWDVVQ